MTANEKGRATGPEEVHNEMPHLKYTRWERARTAVKQLVMALAAWRLISIRLADFLIAAGGLRHD